MSYSIDSAPVTLQNMRHDLVPVQAPTRNERFPGEAQVIQIQSPPMPSMIVVVGYITATGATVALANAALLTAIRNYDALRNDGLTHTVTIHDQNFTDCVLRRFRTMGEVMGVGSSGTKTVMRLVRWDWQQLREGV